MIIFEIADIVTWVFVKLALFFSTALEVRIEFYDPQFPIANCPDRDDSTSIDRRYCHFRDTLALSHQVQDAYNGGHPARPLHLPAPINGHVSESAQREVAVVTGVAHLGSRGISIEEVTQPGPPSDCQTFFTPPAVDPFTTPTATSTILVPPAFCGSPVEQSSPQRYLFCVR